MIPLTIFIVALVIPMCLGISIAFSLLISGLSLMAYTGTYDPQVLASTLVDGADNYPLLAVAFFILTGELMNYGGISKRIINFAIAVFGHVRGGLGYVAILSCFLFSGLSGSAVADTAAVAAILIPIMTDAGYNRATSAALIASSGIVAPLMPLSVAFILFGVTGNVSIPKLFMSGIVPTIIICICLAGVWYCQTRKEENFKVFPRKNFKEKLKAFRGAIWAFLLPLLLIVGLRTGVFTPTEGSAVAVAFALLVGGVVYRELTFVKIYQALLNAGKTASIILFLMAATMVSSWMLSIANIPDEVLKLLAPLLNHKILLMFVINILILVVGTAMDSVPTILIFTPILMPVIEKAGIDPIYFGFMFIFNNMIGLLSPPVGTVLNVAAGVGKVSMNDVIKNVLPYMAYQIILLFLFTAIPQLVTVPLRFLIGK